MMSFVLGAATVWLDQPLTIHDEFEVLEELDVCRLWPMWGMWPMFPTQHML